MAHKYAPLAPMKRELKSRTNVTIAPRIKRPAIKLASELGWDLSEFFERAAEAVLLHHGRIKPLISREAFEKLAQKSPPFTEGERADKVRV
jgi:hypothetical protein